MLDRQMEMNVLIHLIEAAVGGGSIYSGMIAETPPPPKNFPPMGSLGDS